LQVALFAGIYFLVYLIDGPGSWNLEPNNNKNAQVHAFSVFLEFLYFSMNIMSTTGISDSYPYHMASKIAIIFQLLISVVYNVVILGIAIAHAARANWAVKNAQADQLGGARIIEPSTLRAPPAAEGAINDSNPALSLNADV
jgi:hypothetical protein